MTSHLAQKVGLGLFQKHLANYAPVDPLYEEYVDKKGRKRTRRRELPPGLSKRDAKILKSVKSRAHYLDKGFGVGSVRFGWTAVVGLIPVVGDLSDIALNYYLVVRKCRQAEIPDWLLRKMLMNNAVSAGLGLVPVAGDVALAAFKANSRNAAIFEEYLRIRGEELLKATAMRVEDPNNVKPGAGAKRDEVIPGKSGGGWFGRRSKAAPKGAPNTLIEDGQAGPSRKN